MPASQGDNGSGRQPKERVLKKDTNRKSDGDVKVSCGRRGSVLPLSTVMIVMMAMSCAKRKMHKKWVKMKMLAKESQWRNDKTRNIKILHVSQNNSKIHKACIYPLIMILNLLKNTIDLYP